MQHTQKVLCAFLGIRECVVVSRAHFPLLLQKVDLVVFEELLFAYYGGCVVQRGEAMVCRGWQRTARQYK